MALVDNNILWNKLGTNAQVDASETGVNGTRFGTVVYGAGKFDNGADLLTAVNYITFTNGNTSPQTGMASFWWKPHYASTEGSNHTMFYSTNGERLNMYWQGPSKTFEVYTFEGVFKTRYRLTPVAFNAEDLIYIQFVWDSTAGAGARLKVYQNGVLLSIATNFNDGAWAYAAAIDINLGGLGAAGFGVGNAVIDNIKLYDSASAQTISDDYDNRNTEGFAVAIPANLSATDGTFTTHVAVTWDASAGAVAYNVYRASDGVTFSELSGWIVPTSFNDTTAIAGVTYTYKVKARNASLAESDFSTTDTGFRAIKINDLTCDKTPPQVLILGEEIDIYQLGYVPKLPIIKEQKTLGRDKFITNSIVMTVRNYDNFFSIFNSHSIFSNIRWQYKAFKYINVDVETRWDGILSDVRPDHNTKLAGIKSKNQLFKERQNKINYQSPSVGETPAEAFMNLADQEGFTDYDNKSVQDSINQYTAEECLIICNFNKSDGITLQQAFEKIAVYGAADIYGHNNKIYFRLPQAFTGGTTITITDEDFRKLPKLSSSEPQLINDYQIDYIGSVDTPTTDNDNNDIGSISRQNENNEKHTIIIDGSSNQQITIKDITSAIFIGETYIRRTHKNLDTEPKPLTIIDFEISSRFRGWIDLTTFFKVSLSDEEWEEKIFETFETIVDDNTNTMKVKAYEVDTNAS